MEVDALRRIVSQALATKTGRSAVCFEHGLCDPTKHAGCGIDHAHLHVMPNPGDVVTEMMHMQAFRRIHSIRDLRSIAANDYEYLFYIDDAECFYYAGVTTPTRQFFRRIITKMAGNEFWNWHDQVLLGSPNNLRATILATRAMFD